MKGQSKKPRGTQKVFVWLPPTAGPRVSAEAAQGGPDRRGGRTAALRGNSGRSPLTLWLLPPQPQGLETSIPEIHN